MKKCVVVIPIYKNEIDSSEFSSIAQCKKVLAEYDIKFVCPEKLEISEELKSLSLDFLKFDDKYFESPKSYSRMLLDKNFYQQFSDYEYMLIYQLDAWVFENKLAQWCDKGYDYVGAPWFKGFSIAKEKAKMRKYAGNGGFSLRKISTFVDILSSAENSDKKMITFHDIFTNRGECSKCDITRLPRAITKFFSKNNVLKVAIKNPPDGEDSIIVNDLRRIYPELKVAEAKDAKFFAFEVLPKRLFKECGEKLPFGCHAYKKYDTEFWKEYIKPE